ncbi:MAG: Ldh family oxidoreductase [Bosea sp.]|nr:Ldh family oxidoreductase [Bosea sp. (in: a-proteobacteria)]
MPRLSLTQIEDLAFGAMLALGASAAQARPVATSVRRAEADDIRSVGLGYLPTYLGHLTSGKVKGSAEPMVRTPRPGAVTVDAAHGFAHPAFDAGLPQLIAAARTNGSATMAITRSYSIGVLGHPVEDIARAGLLALAVSNSPPNIAPWGGAQPLFGTNPMAFAAPRPGLPPLVIDQATSTVTKVSLVAAARAGGPIPSTWALDSEGRPTTDSQAALMGSMQGFGGAKGAGLALIIDLLAAGLTGANFSKDASPYAKAEGPPPGVGQFFMAFDPEAFAPGFADRIADLSGAVLAQKGARLPGDRRLQARARNERYGIDVDDILLGLIHG